MFVICRTKRPSLADQAHVHAAFARDGLPVSSTVLLDTFRDRALSHPELDLGEVCDFADVPDQTDEVWEISMKKTVILLNDFLMSHFV